MSAPLSASALLTVQQAREDYLHLPIASFARALPGLPRGAITELTGRRSSGKTSFLYASLAAATSQSEYCALIDSRDAFDPVSAAEAGVELSRLIWVRCAGNVEHAIKATDLIIQGGGFGLVCLNLTDVPPKALNRIPISYWYRFRLAIQNTSTVFVVLTDSPQAKSCTSCWVDFERQRPLWTGKKPFRLLRGFAAEAMVRKPTPPRSVVLEGKAV